MPFRKAVLSLAVLLLTSAPLALAQGTYTQIDYPGAIGTWCFGIDNAGDIAGSYVDAAYRTHGFILSGNTYTTLDYPGAETTVATAINNVGQVAGQEVSGPITNGFLYDVQTQVFTEISYPNSYGTWPVAINDSGIVAGSFQPAGSSHEQGFEWISSNYREIAPPGAVSTLVWGVTASGELGGYVYLQGSADNVLFARGRYRRVRIPGTFSYVGEGINSTGNAIVGAYGSSAGTVGFVFKNTSVTTLQFAGALDTWAYGINDAGEAVGYIEDSGSVVHGFTWTPPADAVHIEAR